MINSITKIQQGENFSFMWAVRRGGKPEDLERVQGLSVALQGPQGSTIAIGKYTVANNVLTIDITADMVSQCGVYNIELNYTDDSDSTICAVYSDAFVIVPQGQIGDASEDIATIGRLFGQCQYRGGGTPSTPNSGADLAAFVELVASVERVKMAIRMALIAKGVDVPEDAPLEDYPQKIAEITAPEPYLLKSGQTLRGLSFRIAPNVDASQCTSLDNLFAECGLLERVGTLDTRSCTSFYALFHTCLNLISVPTLDTSKGTNLSYMFYACRNLVSIPDMDTSKAVDISFMFSGCSNLRRLPLGNTSSVTNARYLANECSNLEEVGALDLGKVTDFERAFAFCSNLTSWSNQIDTHSAQSIDMMFTGCNRLASDIRIDCINVANAVSAFASCTSLTYIDVNQTPKLTFANSMFNGCTQLTTINGTLILNTLNIHNIFDDCTALQSVEIEQLKCSINLQESPNLSVESVLHLFNHAQEVTGQTINLHRSLEDKLEDEQIEIVVLKGWQVLFHG